MVLEGVMVFGYVVFILLLIESLVSKYEFGEGGVVMFV